MKILAKFIGKVNEYNEPPALSYVTLTNIENKESCDTTAVSQALLDAGVNKVDCEFEILIAEDDKGMPTPLIKKLEPRKVSDEELKAISNEVDDKLPFIPPCYDI